jgi:hypothetical protein
MAAGSEVVAGYRRRRVWPSFETPAARAPQDEAFILPSYSAPSRNLRIVGAAVAP